MAIKTHTSVVTLNEPNAARYTVAEWIQKQDLYISCLQETYLRSEDTYRQSEEMERYSKQK